MKKASNVLETTKAIQRVIFPALMLEMEAPIVLALDNSNKEKPVSIGYLFFIEDEEQIIIEVIEVNSVYRNYNLCKRLISHLITIKPEIKKYSLVNVGGLAGYSCYTDAFNSNNFITKTSNNIATNNKFNGYMVFYRNI